MEQEQLEPGSHTLQPAEEAEVGRGLTGCVRCTSCSGPCSRTARPSPAQPATALLLPSHPITHGDGLCELGLQGLPLP